MLALLAACNAHIARFEVAPRRVCAGTPVTIAWQVQGQASLTVEPKLAGAPSGPVPATGQTTIRPSSKTRVSLRVTRWLGEPTGADVDVNVASPVEIAATLSTMACHDGVLTLATEAKGFADDLRAEWVGAGKRTLDITRSAPDGTSITARVTPGEPATPAFAGLPINGLWTLSTSLGPGESCTSPPHVLTAIVSPACQGALP